MYVTIDKNDLKVLLDDFADLVADKVYQKYPYQKWKDFTSKFLKGNSSYFEVFSESEELDFSDDKGQFLTLDIFDNSLGEYLYFTLLDKENLAPEDMFHVKCKIASSETNANMTRISSDLAKQLEKQGVGVVQCTSSNSYPRRNYKVDFLNERDKEMKGFNFDFGPCTNDNIRMSMYGLAVQNNAGIWVSYNKGQIVDVDIFNFDGRKYMFKMPVAIKDIKAGDIVIHNRVPMFVTSIENGNIAAVDVRAGEAKTIIPTTNMFGFNFVTKIVSMFDNFAATPTADNPFGNMVPFMLMGESDIDPMMFMLMSQNGGQFDMGNPMMLYFMMGKDNKDLLPLMLMMNQKPSKNECACGGNCGEHHN